MKRIDDVENYSTTEVKATMKKLNITKERYEKSRYFKNKYGKLEYVSESGDVYKTDKGKVLTFVKEDVGVTTSTGGHYATFLTDMVAGFLEKQRGIDDVEHGDDGILVTFSDGGKVAVSFDAV